MRELMETTGYRVDRHEPINMARSGKQRILRVFGRHAEEFLAPQYVIIARPAHSGVDVALHSSEV
jgi:hypothetical protein